MHFNSKYKLAVESNFDQSAEIYDAFESRHHLFENLTSRLCELTTPFSPKRILDVGCGSGISTLALSKAFPGPPAIYGLDISQAMLVRAKERCRDRKNIFFIQGDAEILSEYFHENFDAVFYAASIFLIPNYDESIRQACRLIIPGGVLAISYYSGFFDINGQDAILTTFPSMKYRYGSVSFPDLLQYLESRGDLHTTSIDYRFEIDHDFLFDFLVIPAQSAGLFPKIPYIERIPLVRSFCEKLVSDVSPLFIGWKFLISRKGR